MCYDFQAQVITQLKWAIHHRDKEAVRILTERLKKLGGKYLHHTSGFDHPAVLIYTKESPNEPVIARWGFVPEKTKDKDKQLQIWNNTLIARGEEMFEKWSYQYAAQNQRCLICIDGFFEHYHFKGKTYPHYIFREDEKPMTLGGLCSDWEDKETGEQLTTFSIVTTKANALLAKIHNNPKLGESRMPLILPEDAVDTWLNEIVETQEQKETILNLVKRYSETTLDSYTVRRIRGKDAIRNLPEVIDQVTYPELTPPKTLF